jgi:quaternary ammonium compound-resistance protein SugE
MAIRFEALGRAPEMDDGRVCGGVRAPYFLLLGESVRRLPASTVYASFVGIGTLGTAIVGVAFFGESANLWRLGSFLLVIIGLVGLKLFSE